MKTYSKLIGLAALSAATFGLIVLPGSARAQDTAPGTSDSGTPGDLLNQKVTIDVESANLYSALSLMFAQIHANFLLDPSLKQAQVTAHLHSIPFRVALDSLLKSSGLPLTYRVESGVYSVVPKAPDTGGIDDGNINPSQTEPPVEKKNQWKKITEINYNAVALVTALGGTILKVGDDASSLAGFGTGGLGGMGGGFGGLGGGLGGFGTGGIGGIGGYGGGLGGIGGGIGGYGGGGYGGGGYGGGGYGGNRGGYGGGGGYGRGY